MRRNRAALQRALLRWYDANRRALPWRRDRNSYRVWVAEVMLQQTRVEVVIPAYKRFLGRFPSLQALARAEVEDVLAQWSGLGYYTRARSLHAAARCLVQRGARRFPKEYDDARSLPGVGSYTASAVLSIAYGLPYAAVDGNIVRILSRLDCLLRPDARGEPHRALADELLDRERPGDWNQALMELGQTICLPKAPQCGECPLRRSCRAFIEQRVQLHPPPKPRRPVDKIDLTMRIVRDDGGRMLLQRGDFEYLPHLWLPPIQVGAPVNGAKRTAVFRHAILHRQFRVTVVAETVSSSRFERLARQPNHKTFTRAELDGIGRSSLLTKALRAMS